MGIVVNPINIAAVDLGASSGRVMLARVVGGQPIDMVEVHRFPNGAIERDGKLYTDIEGIFTQILVGLAAAVARCAEAGELLNSVGIDSWAVDYGLFDESGTLVGQPRHYRDSRTENLPEQVYEVVSAQEHYAVNGMQTQPFNTEFQLVAEARDGGLDQAAMALLIPDLLGFWLTGKAVAEITNASTTGLVDAAARTWSDLLIGRIESDVIGGIDVRSKLAPIVESGVVIGTLMGSVAERIGARNEVSVIAVGSHDTASAVVGVPAVGSNFAFISCGTWSLVGQELLDPVLTQAAREANFANELGVDGTVRFLKNVMGLWVLQEAAREWQESGQISDIAQLVGLASECEPNTTIIDINDGSLFPPGDMFTRVAALARESGQPVPSTQGEFTRCVIDSLAHAYKTAIETSSALSGQQIDVIHMVGGGIQNRLLCQATADVTGLEVVAGPVEGAALGNVLIQARALGAFGSCPSVDLAALRVELKRGIELVHYLPSSGA